MTSEQIDILNEDKQETVTKATIEAFLDLIKAKYDGRLDIEDYDVNEFDTSEEVLNVWLLASYDTRMGGWANFAINLKIEFNTGELQDESILEEAIKEQLVKYEKDIYKRKAGV